MKYSRFRRKNKVCSVVSKARFQRLSATQQRAYRRSSLRNNFATFVFFVVWLAVGVACVLGFKQIPVPESGFLLVLWWIGNILSIIIAIVLGVIIGGFITTPLWSKNHLVLFAVTHEDAAAGCRHLREYYRLQAPYLLTKCYDSSVKAFTDRDICLFFVNGNLCLTVDLVNGFVWGGKDLGCYAFRFEELSLTKVKIENREAIELRAGKTWFFLGKRAERYIRKGFQENPGKQR